MRNMAVAATVAVVAQGTQLPEPPTEQHPERAMQRAREFQARGEVACALHEFRRVARSIGETSIVLIEIARCYAEIGRLDDAHDQLVASVDRRMAELGADATTVAHAKAVAKASRSVPVVTDSAMPGLAPPGDRLPSGGRAPPPSSASPSSSSSPIDSGMPAMPQWAGNFTGHPPTTRPASASVAPSGPFGVAVNGPAMVSDPILSVAFTELARVELQRIGNLERFGVPQTGSLIHLAIRSGRADPSREIAFRHARVQLWLRQATLAWACNPLAAQLQLQPPTPSPSRPRFATNVGHLARD